MQRIPALCPVNVRASLACSRSQIFNAPVCEPAHTKSSVCPNLTHSIGVVWPLRLYEGQNTTYTQSELNTAFDTRKHSTVPHQESLLRHEKSLPPLNIEKNRNTMIQFCFPTAHRFTFLSSPPVTRTRPDLWPSARQLTLDEWATKSSVQKASIAVWRYPNRMPASNDTANATYVPFGGRLWP